MKNKKVEDKFLNKKAQIGATLTWIVATIIIAFIIFIFIGIIGVKKIAGGKIEVEVSSLGKNDLFLVESFFIFLNKKIDIGGEKISVEDLVASDDKNKLEKFQNLAEDFMEESIMPKKSSIRRLEGDYRRAWIRIYNIDEEVKQYVSGEYKNYNVWRGGSSSSDSPCDPNIKEGLYYDIVGAPKNYLIEHFVPENKKIVICLEYK